MSEEISRLRAVELESFHKDQQVQQLQQKLKELEARVSPDLSSRAFRRVESPHISHQPPVVSGAQPQQQPAFIMGGDPEMTARLLQLEAEVAAKKQEIEQLKEQVKRFCACMYIKRLHGCTSKVASTGFVRKSLRKKFTFQQEQISL